MVRSELVANAQAHAFDIYTVFFVHLHPIQVSLNVVDDFHAGTQAIRQRSTAVALVLSGI